MKSIVCTTFLAAFFLITSAQGMIIEVPGDYSTIQAAINAASDGDTVLVAPNTYYENINFLGKNILLTSHYLFDNDVSFISSTIIDGSQPVHPDTASCVLIISGEDSTAILQGFTLTGGKGTKWTDEHGAGTYVEGGGILMTFSSPKISNNLIINNEAIRTGAGITSAGGGGIRVGDGYPLITNNVIMSNSGMYGGGIVLNYTGAVVRNNIIYNNKVYQAVSGTPTFGGGGIWAYSNFGNALKIIENNTIVANSSSGSGSSAARKGGGILVWSTTIEASNNIVWGNTQVTGGQISQLGGSSNISYSVVENGWSGTGNLSSYPLFAATSLYLSVISPCIDAGNPASNFDDPEDPLNPGFALWPSLGILTNDIGAYGGPARSLYPSFSLSQMNLPNNLDFGTTSPGETNSLSLIISNEGTSFLVLDSIQINSSLSEVISILDQFPRELSSMMKDTIIVSWTPFEEGNLGDTIWLFHNAENFTNPYGVAISGEAIITSVSDDVEDEIPGNFNLSQNYPNPFNPSTIIRYSISSLMISGQDRTVSVQLKVYNILGNEVATIVNKEQQAGDYEIKFNGKELPSGVYFYTLSAGDFVQSKKMVLLK